MLKSIDFTTNYVTQRMHSIDLRESMLGLIICMNKFIVFFLSQDIVHHAMMNEWMKWWNFVWEKWRKIKKETISSFIRCSASSISFAVLMHHANVNEFYRPCNFLLIVFSRTLSIASYVLFALFFSYKWQGEIRSKYLKTLN